MAQGFTQDQDQDPNWISIPIAKFSHNTNPVNVQKFTWIHVSHRNDLDFVMQPVRILDGIHHRIRTVMKVTAGAELLETHDLMDLVEIARRFDHSVGGESPVEVVVRSPFLAMRFPKSVTMVRRMQMKFKNDNDFTKAVNMLRELGLPITDKNATPARPSSVSSSTPNSSYLNQRPASAQDVTSYQSNDFSRPSTATPSLFSQRPSSTASNTALAPSPFPLRHYSALPSPATSSPLRNEIKVLPNFYQQAGSADFDSQNPSQALRSVSAASFVAPFSLSSGLWLNREQPVSEPTKQAPSIYLAQLQKESQDVSPHFRDHQSAAHGNIERGSSGDITQPRSEHSSRLVSVSPHFSSPQMAPMDLGPPNDDPFSGPSSSTAARKDVYDALIPPKRELPFKRPESTPARITQLSTADLPPLPKPTAVSKTNLAGANLEKSNTIVPGKTATPKPAPKKRVAQRKAPASKAVPVAASSEQSPTKEASPAAKEVTMVADEPSPLASKSAGVANRPSSVPPGLVSKAALAPKKRATPVPRPTSITKRPKMNDQCTQTSPLTRKDRHMMMRLPARNEVPELDADASSPNSVASPPENYFSAIENFVVKHKDRPLPQRPSELWETPGYEELNETQRVDMINDFLARRLEDPKFLQLCQDVEHAYMRIGL